MTLICYFRCTQTSKINYKTTLYTDTKTNKQTNKQINKQTLRLTTRTITKTGERLASPQPTQFQIPHQNCLESMFRLD